MALGFFFLRKCFQEYLNAAKAYMSMIQLQLAKHWEDSSFIAALLFFVIVFFPAWKLLNLFQNMET